MALYPLDDVATCVSVAPKIRSFPTIFLGTFENAAPDLFSAMTASTYLRFHSVLGSGAKYWASPLLITLTQRPARGEARILRLGGLEPRPSRVREREHILGAGSRAPNGGPGAQPPVRGQAAKPPVAEI